MRCTRKRPHGPCRSRVGASRCAPLPIGIIRLQQHGDGPGCTLWKRQPRQLCSQSGSDRLRAGGPRPLPSSFAKALWWSSGAKQIGAGDSQLLRHNRPSAVPIQQPARGNQDGRETEAGLTFISDSGELVLWEHLGVLDRTNYRRSWEWKHDWYDANGFREGTNLFTTTEGPGLDMQSVEKTACDVLIAVGML